VEKGCTVLQACEEAGIHVPRFCYHDRLSIAGNCRMCLVEVEKSPKPVASCAMPAMPGMKISTNTPLVHKAREGVMEFLLANHPLDCPICDQGGECDLQDQSMAFGSDKSRLREIKRTVEDKNIGPLVKTVMTRCIHCTRCIRFSTEVAGVTDLGATGRGNNMEIGTYVDKVLDSELSGNVIDLCPVGALTNKPAAFTSRSWELQSTNSVDVLDAVGTNIRVDALGTRVLRILPYLNEEINEEWLSDKSRFSVDGLKSQRLDTPMMRVDGELKECTWKEALLHLAKNLQGLEGKDIAAVAGDMVDAEAMISLKDLINRLGSNNTSTQVDVPLSADVRSSYLFNATISGLEDADQLLLVGSNPRMEAPLVNARIRKSHVNYGLKVHSVGPRTDLTYAKTELGNDMSTLAELAVDTHPVAMKLKNAEQPVILVGMGALATNPGVKSAVQAIAKLNPNTKISYLHTNASRVAAQDIGFVPGVGAGSIESSKFVYLLGADCAAIPQISPSAFVVYQGSHGDAGASRADVILPGATYVEKDGTYVNLEGRPQRSYAASNTVGHAKEDWKIVRAVSEVVGKPLPYATLDAVRERLADVSPTFARIGVCEAVTFSAQDDAQVAISGPFKPYYDNHWLTNVISRSSVTMGKCSNQMPKATNSYLKEGQAHSPYATGAR
jgi:NADH-quinone oxidoreductase chain G